jgi:hypothetical protein
MDNFEYYEYSIGRILADFELRMEKNLVGDGKL